MLIITRLVTNPFGRRSLHLSVSHTIEPSRTPAIGHTHAESTQAKVLPVLPGLDVFPDMSSQPVADLRLTEPGTLQLMVVPASEEYCPR